MEIFARGRSCHPGAYRATSSVGHEIWSACRRSAIDRRHRSASDRHRNESGHRSDLCRRTENGRRGLVFCRGHRTLVRTRFARVEVCFCPPIVSGRCMKRKPSPHRTVLSHPFLYCHHTATPRVVHSWTVVRHTQTLVLGSKLDVKLHVRYVLETRILTVVGLDSRRGCSLRCAAHTRKGCTLFALGERALGLGLVVKAVGSRSKTFC